MMKQCLMTIVLVMTALGAMANSNRVYIDHFEVYPDSTITVPIMLSNTDETRGVQFYMTLPQGLKIKKSALTDHSKDYDMHLSVNYSKEAKCYTVFIYPMNRICLPPDTKAIMTIKLAASSEFKGGDVVFFNVCGSTIDNVLIHMDGSSTSVSVPESAVVGTPIEQGSPE